jgi:hypothetical protein
LKLTSARSIGHPSGELAKEGVGGEVRFFMIGDEIFSSELPYFHSRANNWTGARDERRESSKMFSFKLTYIY